MTGRWVDIAGAAMLAGRTERSIRNWVADGTLAEASKGTGIFDAAAVLEAKKTKAGRVGRPKNEPAPAGGTERD